MLNHCEPDVECVMPELSIHVGSKIPVQKKGMEKPKCPSCHPDWYKW